MWCLPCCLKPSTSEDRFEADTSKIVELSEYDEADIQEAKQLSLAIQESSLLRQREEEEERKRELDKDAQIANGLLYEERERQVNHKSASEDEENEQLAEALRESLKEIGKQYEDEQVKKDREFAERLNMLESPPQSEENNSISRRAPSNVDEQLSKVLEESSNDKGKGKQFEDEQVKKDRELAERLNMIESPLQSEENNRISRRAPSNVDEQLSKVLEEISKDKGKGKQFEDEQVKKDRELAERLNMLESPPRLEENNNISTRAPLDEDEQRIILESLKGKGQITQSKDEVEEDGELLEVNPPRSMCGGCNSAVDHERSVNVSGVLWHPKCLICHVCDKPIAIHKVERSVNVSGVLWHPNCLICHACDKPIAIHKVENHVSNSRGTFHKPCYERYCYVCKEKKLKSYNKHPFWKEKYCPTHEDDGTLKCCSCERLEPKGTNYVMLGDGRWLCLECMESAVMDSHECQPLHFEIREFFEGLYMKIEKEFPFLLVEKQALNKAEKEEKIDHQSEVITRGICLSEEQIVTSVSKLPKEVVNNRLIGIARESQRVVRECEVTAILILYGLPRLVTGYILAHEMMHAYLRINGHRNLNNVLEEGLCQVLGHMWLEAETYATVDTTAAAASSSSSSRTPPVAIAPKKGEWSDFEKKLVEFCKNQIETDESPVYGDGFRIVNKMVKNSNIQETLKEILRRS